VAGSSEPAAAGRAEHPAGQLEQPAPVRLEQLGRVVRDPVMM
jgi:hypothetical protein